MKGRFMGVETGLSSNTDTLGKLVAAVQKVVGRDDIDPAARLSELGLDSLTVVEVLLECDTIYPKVKDFESVEINESTTLITLDKALLELQSRVGL
jgi:hypothetical protein